MALVVMACTGTKGTGEQTAEVAPDTLLSAAVDDGSLWTDGSNCYTARRSGDTIVFEGGNLHEGGAVVYMLLTSDTTLVVKPVTGWGIDDYSMFATVNSEVKHQRVGGYELLVARDSVGNPIDVLQGINDAALDLLDFNTRIINNVWAGTYQTEAGERYVFTPDGKVQLPGSDKPEPYTFDLMYDTPNGSIKVGDKHLAVQVVPEGIDVFRSDYNSDEEVWLASELVAHARMVEGEPQGRYNYLLTTPALSGIYYELGLNVAALVKDKLAASPRRTSLIELNIQLLEYSRAAQMASEHDNE